MPDLVEARGEDMLNQPAQEFHRMNRGGPAVFGAERDLIAGGGLDSGVGDADPVRIPSEILVMWCTT